MNKIFIGLFFITFNLVFTFVCAFFKLKIAQNGVGIGVLPDFMGYILILLGTVQHQKESIHLKGLKIPLAAVIVGNAAIYFINLMGRFDPDMNPVFTVGMNFFFAILYIWIIYGLTKGVRDLEMNTMRDLNFDKLNFNFGITAALILVSQVPIFQFIILVAVLGSYLAKICYTVEFGRAASRYYKLMREKATLEP